ncbi:MAG: UDP-N-acetylmuramoyl-L-alanyl-D-glutamate--2,6-diaminopimelate ligase [bacterium]
MDLRHLVTALKQKEVKGEANPRITGITQDSRKVQPGFLFVCICGFQLDGHNYLEEAVRRGAVAVVIEKDLLERSRSAFGSSLVWIRVQNSREALALLSSAFYQHPSSRMRVIGITGTNGKTTTTYLVASILETAGFGTGLLNTLTCRIRGEEMPAVRTTPESVDLQRSLAHMVDKGCQYAVIEVSSHALILNRVLGCEFDVGVLTNITSDHLDFHENLAEYRRAKQLLFTGLGDGPKSPKAAVLNLDDPSFQVIEKSTAVPVYSYGVEGMGRIRAERIETGRHGLSFEVSSPAGRMKIRSPLSGLHNVYNILAAIGVGVAEGIDTDTIEKGIEAVSGIPGRFETISCGQDFWVVVDFAHTPDALQRLLEAGRQLKPLRLITVFGCGGDRDKSKRSPMGRIAAGFSDHLIITNDNPRSEDPLAIARQIEEGVRSVSQGEGEGRLAAGRISSAGYEIILDRYQAIEKALIQAKAGDMVVIAGKGHEQYQVIGSECKPFDDRQVVRQILSNLKVTC